MKERSQRIQDQLGRWKAHNRFMRKVRIAHDKSDCWLWKGNTVKDKYGFYPYGKIWTTGEDGTRHAKQAHRVVYEWYANEPLGDKVLVNKCGKTLCVNPQHWSVADHWRHG